MSHEDNVRQFWSAYSRPQETGLLNVSRLEGTCTIQRPEVLTREHIEEVKAAITNGEDAAYVPPYLPYQVQPHTVSSADPERRAELDAMICCMKDAVVNGTQRTIVLDSMGGIESEDLGVGQVSNFRVVVDPVAKQKKREARRYEPTRSRVGNAVPIEKSRAKNRAKSKAARAARKASR